MTLDEVLKAAKTSAINSKPKELRKNSPSLMDGIDPNSEVPEYLQFLAKFFPHIAHKPMAERHHRLWRWFESLKLGVRQEPHVEIWCRGGAKSTSTELGVTYIGIKLARRYVLYVSATQDLADKHVSSIASFLESAGVDRQVGKYGNSKGWRRNQLRASNGFNVEALGLDTASRGIKLDEFRPDLIIFDDIDERDDTPKATRKKISTITDSLLPTMTSEGGSSLFIQNLIIEDGVFHRLLKRTAGFLHNAEIHGPEPAIKGLRTELCDDGSGKKVPTIVAGEPTWLGQSLAVCQADILERGLDSFLRESQHEVENSDGFYFDVAKVSVVKTPPQIKKIVIGCDIAATEGGGDYTAAVPVAECYNGTFGALDLLHGQFGTEKVERKITLFAREIKAAHPGVKLKIAIPLDPGAAGKLFADAFAKRLREDGFEVTIYKVSKAKPVVAKGIQRVIGEGNFWLLEGDWNQVYLSEHKKFREDMDHDHDDIVDGAANGFNCLTQKSQEDILSSFLSKT